MRTVCKPRPVSARRCRCQLRQQVPEALPLHHHVVAQSLGSSVRVAGQDGRDNRFVFAERGVEAVAHAQLQAPVGPQAAMQLLCLLLQEASWKFSLQ